LHEIVGGGDQPLLLVSNLPDSADALLNVYARRVDVEIDIRNLKIVLDTENLRGRSVNTFRKELLASVVSYNPVTQFRRQAAELAKVPPRQLSFKRTWTTYRTFPLSHMYTNAKQWREQYDLALSYAMKDELPHRPGRSYAKEAYSRRPKPDQFKKRKRKPAANDPER